MSTEEIQDSHLPNSGFPKKKKTARNLTFSFLVAVHLLMLPLNCDNVSHLQMSTALNTHRHSSPSLFQCDLCKIKMKAFKTCFTYVIHHLSYQWHDQNYVVAYQLQSAVLTLLCLMFSVWLPCEDLVNAVAGWRLADTPACHGWSPYSGQTN